MSSEKSFFRSFEGIILIGAIGLLAYVLLSDGGCGIVERSEEVKMIERASGSDYELPPDYVDRDEAEKEARVEAMLEEFNRDMVRQENFENRPSSTQKWGLSKAEKDYYAQLKDRYDSDDQMQEAIDWMSLLKSSHQTYSKVRSIFQEAAQASGIQLRDAQVDEALEEEAAAQLAFRRLSDWYRISEEDIRQFAQEGEKSVGDWADFIREQQR
ncbi:MAG: hypothetical protein AAFP19_03460 [Bacteroidota bacterium]